MTVVERVPRGRLAGSTGHAPGFVGLLNESPVATGLARASADRYERLERDGLAGFDRVGGLEVAETSRALDDLRRRAALAAHAGLPATVLDPVEAAAASPLVDPDRTVGAVLHPHDGTARAGVVTAELLDRAAAAGVRLRHGTAVTGIVVGGGAVRAVRAGGDVLPADDVVIACGIWGPAVAALAGAELPLIPVAHPYVHGPRHVGAPARSSSVRSPFVRWPEHHVYARDHGDRLGLGTYDHAPLPVPRPGAGAERPWPADLFDPAVARALALLPAPRRFTPEHRLNGVFSMTPDNLPLLGAVSGVAGLWVAEALWVTHAAGAARALAQLMLGAEPDVAGLEALRPDRFAGLPPAELADRSLRLYRDIYASA